MTRPTPGRFPDPGQMENYGRHHDRLVPQGAIAMVAVLLGLVIAVVGLIIVVLVRA